METSPTESVFEECPFQGKCNRSDCITNPCGPGLREDALEAASHECNVKRTVT